MPKQGKTAFKRRKAFEKKPTEMVASTLITDSTSEVGLGGLGDVKAMPTQFKGFTTALENVTAEGHGDAKRIPIVKKYPAEILPSPNVPKRGPVIWVCVKDCEINEETLRIVFGQFGRIVGINLKPSGVAFVTFLSIENAELAVAEVRLRLS